MAAFVAIILVGFVRRGVRRRAVNAAQLTENRGLCRPHLELNGDGVDARFVGEALHVLHRLANRDVVLEGVVELGLNQLFVSSVVNEMPSWSAFRFHNRKSIRSRSLRLGALTK